MTGPRIALEGATLSKGHAHLVNDVTLEVPGGGVLGLLGRSGSGKTSLLRLIAGLEAPSGGYVTLGEEIVASPTALTPPHRRGVGLVFQDLALWPHLTVTGHLKLVARGDRDAVAKWTAACQLTHCARRRPDQLSGGERQRLALARALLPGPRVLLLDEPFTGCDPALAADLRALVAELIARESLTAVLVSHAWREMEGLVTKVAVMDGGEVIAQGAVDGVRAALQGTPHGMFFR